MSYRQIFYQIVFGTKHRKKTIAEQNCEQLYKYIWGIIKNKNCKLYRINGAEDHIHIFSDLHPSTSLSDYIKNQKEHHKKETFYDEFKRLLIENGIEFNEKYLL